jgi:transketolase
MDAIQKANSGHPGLPLGAAELAAVLYGRILKHNPANPDWKDRDRFVLSAGHGSMFLYSILHLSGYGVPLEDVKNFRQIGSKCPGHPEYGYTPGVETTTGPLGQGVSMAVGMAIAETMLAARFNAPGLEVVDHYTYALVGEGCLMEGVASEASSLAGHLKLGKLIVFYDENRICIDGSTDITFSEDIAKRYEAYGWQVLHGDMYDMAGIEGLVASAKKAGKPALVMLKSVIGKGAASVAGTAKAHGAPIGAEGIAEAKKSLGIDPAAQFYVAPAAYEYFAKRKGEFARSEAEWDARFAKWAAQFPDRKAQWDEAFAPGGVSAAALARAKLPEFKPGESVATRTVSNAALNAFAAELPNLVGGSADLQGPNAVAIKGAAPYTPADRSGRYLHFGVREFGMAAVANGLQVHGGLRAFCATFLIFSDYLRPALRLSALMKQPVIYVLTHDSIYLGEDGPTHQPVETIAALRAIPNVLVLRPADPEETVIAWRMALARADGPTCLALTRQNVPVLEKDDPDGGTRWSAGPTSSARARTSRTSPSSRPARGFAGPRGREARRREEGARRVRRLEGALRGAAREDPRGDSRRPEGFRSRRDRRGGNSNGLGRMGRRSGRLPLDRAASASPAREKVAEHLGLRPSASPRSSRAEVLGANAQSLIRYRTSRFARSFFSDSLPRRTRAGGRARSAPRRGGR